MSTYQLQIAVAAALNADAPLMALVNGVYDNPLQVANPVSDSAFPFVTLSDGSSTPWDTDTELGRESAVIIHTWSRARHALEAKQIQDAIYNAVHRGTIPIVGSQFIGCDEVQRTVERDPDGITRHGVQEFKIIYEEV